jgi:hypothetical protein
MRQHLSAFLVAMLATTFTAACSGDDDADETSTSEVTAFGDESIDESDVPATTSDGRPTLSGILDRQEGAVIKVTYRRGGDEFTIAQDGDRRSVRRASSLVIVTDDATVSCDDLETEPTCLEVPPEVGDILGAGLTFFDVLAQSLASLADRSPRLETTEAEITGRVAVCVEGASSEFLSEIGDLADSVPDVHARVCVDEATGYLLEYASDGDPADDLVAVAVTEPTDTDFDPPATVDPLPGGDV